MKRTKTEDYGLPDLDDEKKCQVDQGIENYGSALDYISTQGIPRWEQFKNESYAYILFIRQMSLLLDIQKKEQTKMILDITDSVCLSVSFLFEMFVYFWLKYSSSEPFKNFKFVCWIAFAQFSLVYVYHDKEIEPVINKEYYTIVKRIQKTSISMINKPLSVLIWSEVRKILYRLILLTSSKSSIDLEHEKIMKKNKLEEFSDSGIFTMSNSENKHGDNGKSKKIDTSHEMYVSEEDLCEKILTFDSCEKYKKNKTSQSNKIEDVVPWQKKQLFENRMSEHRKKERNLYSQDDPYSSTNGGIFFCESMCFVNGSYYVPNKEFFDYALEQSATLIYGCFTNMQRFCNLCPWCYNETSCRKTTCITEKTEESEKYKELWESYNDNKKKRKISVDEFIIENSNVIPEEQTLMIKFGTSSDGNSETLSRSYQNINNLDSGNHINSYKDMEKIITDLLINYIVSDTEIHDSSNSLEKKLYAELFDRRMKVVYWSKKRGRDPDSFQVTAEDMRNFMIETIHPLIYDHCKLFRAINIEFVNLLAGYLKKEIKKAVFIGQESCIMNIILKNFMNQNDKNKNNQIINKTTSNKMLYEEPIDLAIFEERNLPHSCYIRCILTFVLKIIFSDALGDLDEKFIKTKNIPLFVACLDSHSNDKIEKNNFTEENYLKNIHQRSQDQLQQNGNLFCYWHEGAITVVSVKSDAIFLNTKHKNIYESIKSLIFIENPIVAVCLIALLGCSEYVLRRMKINNLETHRVNEFMEGVVSYMTPQIWIIHFLKKMNADRKSNNIKTSHLMTDLLEFSSSLLSPK